MAKLKPPVGSNDHFQGDEKAPVELVEYGDYQCPHCGRAYPIIKKIQERMGEQLKFVFRNFPLSEIHPQATIAALAAEAAARQDKFWEMHDMIFENQQSLSGSSILTFAAKLKLDIEKFEAHFELPATREKVESDFESGVRSGVNGTPSFFINGEKYNESWDEEPFLDYLKTIIK